MKKHEMRPARAGHAGEEPSGYRHERLSRLLREELDALVRDELGDPRLEGVRITTVELSVDYKNVRVGFVGPATGHDARDRMGRALARATPFLRARLAEALDLKVVPVLRFAWDAYAAAAPGEEG
jgi:ribosome-binding factor A